MLGRAWTGGAVVASISNRGQSVENGGGTARSFFRNHQVAAPECHTTTSGE